MSKKNKNKTPMEKLTYGYEKFIKGKDVNKEACKIFEKASEKAAKRNN